MTHNLDEKTRHYLQTIRCDLAWAYLQYGPPESAWRFKSGIRMITTLLNDEEKWEELKQHWEEEDPGTIAKLYDPPPEKNPAP